MKEDTLKSEVLKSLAWMGGLKYLGQIFSWVITIVVIRILNPSDYGLMAEATFCVGILTWIGEMGLGAAVVQRKAMSTEELQRLFGLLLIANAGMAALLFFGAGLIAAYFREPRLIAMLRVLSVTFLLMGSYALPLALMLKEMNFKAKAFWDLMGALLTSFATLALALLGFGVWALVAGSLAMHVVFAFGYNYTSRTWVRPSFNFRGTGSFLSFGGFLTGSRALWYFYMRADIFIGGRFLGDQPLGILAVAKNLSSLPMEKIFPIITQIAFPAYAKIQSDPESIRQKFFTSIRLVSLTMMPLFAVLFVVTPEVVRVVLGEKWLEVIVPMQILCLVMPLRALASLFSPVLLGTGRSRANFVNVLITAVILGVGFLFGVRAGVVGLCYVWLAGFTVAFIIMLYRTLGAIGSNITAFLSASCIPFICSVLLVFACMALKLWVESSFPDLVTGAVVGLFGAVIYLAGIFLIRRELLKEVLNLFSR